MAYRPDDLDRVDPLGERDLDAEPTPPEGAIAASNGETSGASALQDATVTAEGSAGLQSDAEDTAPPADADEEIQVARAEIEQTRAELSETIDAIQEKLSPDNLKEQAKETVKEATIGKVEQTVTGATDRAAQTVSTASDRAAQTASTASARVAETVSTASDTVSGAGSSAAQNVRQNVIPLLVIGLGVAGVAIGGRRVRGRRQKRAQLSRSGRAGQTVSQAQQRVGQVAGQAKDKAGQLRERAGRVGGKAQVVPDSGGPFQARVGQIKDATTRLARRGQDQTQKNLQDQRSSWDGTGLLEDTPIAVIDLIAALAVAIALAVARRAKRENWF